MLEQMNEMADIEQFKDCSSCLSIIRISPGTGIKDSYRRRALRRSLGQIMATDPEPKPVAGLIPAPNSDGSHR
jgi:hypothetical protein